MQIVDGDLNVMAALILWVVIVYYLFFAWILRLHGRQKSVMTTYHPPPGISPALAAYFLHPGDSATTLATCLVDLVQRGAMRLRRLEPDGYYLECGDDAVELHAYERELRERLSESPLSARAVLEACEFLSYSLEDWVVPRYLSMHYLLFLLPCAVSLVVAVQLISPYLAVSGRGGNHLQHEILFSALTAILCYWGAISLRAFATKVCSWIPGHHGPRLPLESSDLKALWVTVLAGTLFCIAASYTRAWPLIIFAGFAAVNVFGRSLLRTPTREGWQLYDRLLGFQWFLSAVEADQINTLTTPTEVPKKIQDNLAFALAFDLENSWGKQLQLFLTQCLVSGEGAAVIRGAAEAFASQKDLTIR
jgi:hypothetical protein